MLNVLLAAVAATAIGMFWFSPAGFGRAWMKEEGLSMKDMKKMTYTAAQAMGIGFVLSLVTAYVLGMFVEGLNVGMAAERSAWVWLGFMLPILYGQVLWSGKTNRLFLITGSYWLVTLVVMAVVLVSF